MANRAVIVGGFVTGKRLLEPVADELCKRLGFADANVFRFRDAIDDPDKLERALWRQAVFTHSAGILAVAQCVGMERAVVFNAPEPTRVAKLIASAAIKGGNFLEAIIAGPNRRASARVIASNIVQAVAHPRVHAKHIPVISRFSTTEQLGLMRSAGVLTARIDTVDDEFFGPYVAMPWDGEKMVLPGCHDQVLIDPVRFIGELPEEVFVPN